MLPALVLVADPDEDFREAVAWALRVRGFRVLSAGSGQQAIWLASIHRVSLVVIDAETPEIDGVTALRRIREDPRAGRTAAILMTRAPMGVDGEFATIKKPLQIEDLVRMADWMLGGTRRLGTPPGLMAVETFLPDAGADDSGDDPEPSSGA
jgi:CheY-like chemotaxis protein